MEPIFNYIDNNFESFIEDLQKVCRQPSISAQNKGLRECAAIIADKFTSLGMEVQIWETEGAPVVYGRLKGESDKTLLFYNHYDVQPIEPVEDWSFEPFGAKIHKGRMFGRGTADNKSALYSRIHAVESWLKIHDKLPISVAFIVEGEEEIGSPHLAKCIQAHRHELTADLCIWENSYRDLNGYPETRLGNKGLLSVELSVETSQVDFHSSYAAVIPNAAWRLVNALSTLVDSDGKILIEGFYDDIKDIEPEEMAELRNTLSVEEELKVRSGRTSLAHDISGFEVNRRLFTEPTCNISGISSGYTGGGEKTVLPGKAYARIDMRMVLGQDPLKINSLLRTHLDKHGFSDVKISENSRTQAILPAKTPVSTPYLALMRKAVSMVTDKPLRVFTTSPGTGPRYLFSEWTDMPIMSSGAGNAHSRAHAPDENILLTDYKEEIKIIASLISLL